MNTHTLASFLVSAMFSSALISTAPNPFIAAATAPQPSEVIHSVEGLGAAGWQTPSGTVLTRPTQQIQAPTPQPLSQDQLQRLLSLLDGPHGRDVDLDAKIAKVFGIEIQTVRNLYIKDSHGTTYELSRLKDEKGYLISRHTDSSVHILMIGTDLSLVSGITRGDDHDLIIMPVSAAQSALQADLTIWARIADRLGQN